VIRLRFWAWGEQEIKVLARSRYPINMIIGYLQKCGSIAKFPEKIMTFRIHDSLIDDLGEISLNLK
jgi:hypothetical protein